MIIVRSTSDAIVINNYLISKSHDMCVVVIRIALYTLWRVVRTRWEINYKQLNDISMRTSRVPQIYYNIRVPCDTYGIPHEVIYRRNI